MSDDIEAILERSRVLARGLVWCVECGRQERVNYSAVLASGWPKCCGSTMTLDSPEERAAFARSSATKETT